MACQNGHVDVARMLIEKDADVGQADKNDGATPLFMACQTGHVDVARLLIEKDADVGQAKNDGATPLFMACQNGHSDLFVLLIEKGANIETPMHGNGWTPLFVAAWAGNDGVVGALLSAGANPTAETTADHLGVPAGSTPLSVARDKGHAEIAHLLEARSRA